MQRGITTNTLFYAARDKLNEAKYFWGRMHQDQDERYAFKYNLSAPHEDTRCASVAENILSDAGVSSERSRKTCSDRRIYAPRWGFGPYGIATGPDGALWFAEETAKIGRLVPA